jgi:hypothetical protein
MINYLQPVAWLIGDKVFRTIQDAEQYQRMFTHHNIIPLFRNV